MTKIVVSMDEYMELLREALSLSDLKIKRKPDGTNWDFLIPKEHKPVKCQVEIIEEEQELYLPCGHYDRPRDDCFDCQSW